MLTTLSPSLPAGLEVPDELEQAWCWMEDQGWSIASDHGYFLAPYAGHRVSGAVFGAVFGAVEGFLDLWLVPGFPVDRLATIGTIGSDGSAAAIWLDDERALRFVGLGADGEAYLLADSAVDFLRLVAVGHRELTADELGLPPDDESVAALAPFRSWVEATFDVVVPAEWPAVGDDEFTDWVERASGATPPAALRQVPDDSPAAEVLAGDARSLLRHVGGPDGSGALHAVASTVGAVVSRDITQLRWAGAALRAAGLEVSVRRGVVQAILVRLAAYPRPEDLVDGLAPNAGADDVLALLGPPEWSGPRALRYVVDGRYLHLELGADGIERLALMLTALRPGR
ncbi:hypothetical protein [Nocardioides daeguensis]|uniref:SMI1/KNR4 family protein n=1 Tax=Nocardioides daeguensis TaxID=908359 RepID=A0ABP6VY66_9ACTN|nr:hypothetical protein [Nocardioides daeguensis]MBV6726917.1 hypothetical protein [Nocardioides daeguensis]MCR1772916.1 hypothetical protein [Nocardioides daeguensis]